MNKCRIPASVEYINKTFIENTATSISKVMDEIIYFRKVLNQQSKYINP